ncbi:hypothetical protein F4813DRAFT_235945 [Daldinia decipiens]|uniref:uncharacterized protein n=1 Tax=Daldinia decipiens TaxID=326647 RepID=UPI0020C50F20|nr:uncharacterized protein F4813DRAFT_235945 [Daldinia decipiens]KAI1654119.1 hypothetical protein F4813DRAFT_235945 [Daldinia decipiens]
MASDSEQDYQEDPNEGFEDDLDLPEDGNDVHMKREESYEGRLKAAVKTIKMKGKFENKNDINMFLHEYGDIAGGSPLKVSGNLLHALIDVVKHTDDIKSKDIEILIRELVRIYPELLIKLNKDGHNPIFMAIRASRHQLVEYMISSCIDNQGQSINRESVSAALRMKAPGGETCLHAVFKERFNSGTVSMLIENASDEALSIQDSDGKTPMHYAISFKECTEVRAKLIELFIERDLNATRNKQRPQNTFLDLFDKDGLSIYREHQNTRDIITRKFMKRRQATGSMKQDQTDASRLPKEPMPQVGIGYPGGSAIVRPTNDREEERYGRVANRSGGLDERETLRQKKKAEEAAGRDTNRNQITRVNEPSEKPIQLAAKVNGTARQQEPPSPNTPVKRSNTIHSEATQDREKEKLLASTAEKNIGKLNARTKISDKILLDLKLHYMRTRNAEKVINFLYGSNMNDIQTSFDYDTLPRNILWKNFIGRFGADSKSGLKFDSVLQYVTLPHIEVRQKGRLADQDAKVQSKIHQPGALGCEDMKYIFDWLYNKGVRHIIRLTVEDTGYSGEKVHSDQAIQKSLENFVVEHLDWQKVDLDPETILHVSSKVNTTALTHDGPKDTESAPYSQLKQLYLRWSGSNAVLRAWSEPEGLPMLPQLLKVCLYRPPSEKAYDNLEWIDKKIMAFQTRLNANRKAIRDQKLAASGNQVTSSIDIGFNDVEVIATDLGIDESKVTSSNVSHSTAPTLVKGVNSHRWLKSTARFAGEMIPFWENTVKEFLETRKNQGTQERIEDDVILALIDDGVDMFDATLDNHVLEGKSFDFHDGKIRPPFSSARGHGTVMASMILRVCPMAKVYPIRLKTYQNENGKNTIDKDYAARAIQAALDKKATIISMSWTLPMKNNKSDSKTRLDTVLKKAVDSKVLMFCSAPDEGKFTELDYPSGPWRDRFFRIGAARADGTVFPWTPDDGITYVLPGVDVIKEQAGKQAGRRPFETHLLGGTTAREVDVKYETGSSVATALAAGLAAMIIYCVKASILAVKTANQNKGSVVGIAIPDNGANLITDPDAMKRAFASLGSVTQNKFIQVWEELDNISELLEAWRGQDLSTEAKLEQIERFVKFGRKLWNSVKY